ncbi:MAG TPA: ABC transporter ATP-binding protein, partial [Bacillota bacterium]|nr:ABC transporter ATP-binding protein [Bacillota bacterium]
WARIFNFIGMGKLWAFKSSGLYCPIHYHYLLFTIFNVSLTGQGVKSMNGLVARISNLSKKYKNKTVLAPIQLDIFKGECVVLCGGNGAGKSTLIKMLVGILQPTTGEFLFHTENKKKFGYMPDQMNFQGELTPVEILQYYGSFVQANKEKINQVLQRVGLWEQRNQKVSSFSKGMGQRLNLAQALLAEVDLYIFDEPTNGLDPFWVIEFKNIIQELKERGKSVLLSSHIMRDVVDIADRVAFIFEGEMKACGALAEIYQTCHCSSLEEVFLSFIQGKRQDRVLASASV